MAVIILNFARGNKFQIVKGYHSDNSYNINLDAFLNDQEQCCGNCVTTFVFDIVLSCDMAFIVVQVSQVRSNEAVCD